MCCFQVLGVIWTECSIEPDQYRARCCPAQTEGLGGLQGQAGRL